jgi:glycosyl transferase family 25
MVLPSSQMFVINLDRSPERMQRFRQLNSHLPHITRFPAVDGRTVNRSTLIDQQIFAEPIFFKGGSVGNTMSNRELWKMAAGKSEYITIFEDDAIIHKDFAALAPALIAELPHDWDIALWGWNFDAPMSFDILRGVPCLARFSQSDLRKQWKTLQTDTIRPALHQLHYSFGTVAYSLSPAGAKKLLARVFPVKPFLYRLPRHNVEIENLSIDCALASLYDGLNAYVCVPPLALTNNDHAASTVQEDWRQRRFWRLRRIKQSLFGTAALPPDESSFRVTLATDYPRSREYMRKYAHYLYRKGDRFGAVREYLKHLFMRH